MSIVMVVLSPPGSTMRSSPSRSSRVRTRRWRAPDFSRARMCSAKAPCIARTPMRGRARAGRPRGDMLLDFPNAPCARPAAELPASCSGELVLGDGWDLETIHRLPQSCGHLGQTLWLVVVSGGRDDRLGTLQGVLRLEDARPDEDSVDSQLHHQCGVGGRRYTARGEVDDWQATEPLAPVSYT